MMTKTDMTRALAKLKVSLVKWFAGLLTAHALATTGPRPAAAGRLPGRIGRLLRPMVLGGVYYLLTRFLPAAP